MMQIADKLLSTYTDQTLGLKAVTFITEGGTFGARFYKDGLWLVDELYEGHNEMYAENAAENYVLGIMNP